jgi:hypothetical protein
LVLLGLFNTWLIILPDPAAAPVIPPVIVPNVQLNVLGIVADKDIFASAPLQITAVGGLIMAGSGFTVTVIVYGVPGQAVPAVDVGVTIYSTLPAAVLLGLFSV